MSKFIVTRSDGRKGTVETNSHEQAAKSSIPKDVKAELKEINQPNMAQIKVQGARVTKYYLVNIATTTPPSATETKVINLNLNNAKARKEFITAVLDGLTLTNYTSYGTTDISHDGGKLMGLTFEGYTPKYRVKLNMDDFDFEAYGDCGDICIDHSYHELMVLEQEDELKQFMQKYVANKPYKEIQLKGWEWYDMYQDLRDELDCFYDFDDEDED